MNDTPHHEKTSAPDGVAGLKQIFPLEAGGFEHPAALCIDKFNSLPFRAADQLQDVVSSGGPETPAVIRKSIWIIGGGHFGRKALKTVKPRHADWQVTLIEQDPDVCAQLALLDVLCVCMDGIEFMQRHLEFERPQWVLPMIPQHVAFLWLQRHLAASCQLIPITAPPALQALVPNPVNGAGGELYTSNADFLCPDNCAEPDARCSHTRLPRPRIMWKWLNALDLPGFKNVVIASRQFAPGIGGYAADDLLQTARMIACSPGRYLLSTACKCHAVVQAFELRLRPER